MWIYQHQDWHDFRKTPELYGHYTSHIPLLLDLRARSHHLRAKVAALGLALSDVEIDFYVNHLRSSWLIEGEYLDDHALRTSFRKHLGGLVRGDGASVTDNRYSDDLASVTLEAMQTSQHALSCELLFKWHTKMFHHDQSLDQLTRSYIGKWRNTAWGDMVITSHRIGGKTPNDYAAPPGDQVAEEMSWFLNWYNRPSGVDGLDLIVKAGIAHFWFEVIHPFVDGNGRMGRIICERMLSQAHGNCLPFYSCSAQILNKRKEYYKQLAFHSRMRRPTLDLTRWITWFVKLCDAAMADAEATWNHTIKIRKFWHKYDRFFNDSQRCVLKKMTDKNFKGLMNAKKYQRIAKCTRAQAQQDMDELIGSGFLHKDNHQTSYHLNLNET